MMRFIAGLSTAVALAVLPTAAHAATPSSQTEAAILSEWRYFDSYPNPDACEVMGTYVVEDPFGMYDFDFTDYKCEYNKASDAYELYVWVR